MSKNDSHSTSKSGIKKSNYQRYKLVWYQIFMFQNPIEAPQPDPSPNKTLHSSMFDTDTKASGYNCTYVWRVSFPEETIVLHLLESEIIL